MLVTAFTLYQHMNSIIANYLNSSIVVPSSHANRGRKPPRSWYARSGHTQHTKSFINCTCMVEWVLPLWRGKQHVNAAHMYMYHVLFKASALHHCASLTSLLHEYKFVQTPWTHTSLSLFSLWGSGPFVAKLNLMLHTYWIKFSSSDVYS